MRKGLTSSGAGQQLLTAVAATGAGSGVNVAGARTFGMQVKATGGPATCIVTLEGTIDGTDWFKLGTWDITVQANGDIVFVVDKPVAQVRANLTTLTGGASPTVSAWVQAAY